MSLGDTTPEDCDFPSDGAYLQHALRTFEGVTPVGRQGEPVRIRVAAGQLGCGRVATMQGGPMEIHRRVVGRDSTTGSFNLLINRIGVTHLEHCSRTSTLLVGDVTLLDGARDFRADLPDTYSEVLIQFPRNAIRHRHPNLVRHAGVRFSHDEPSVQLVAQMASLIAAQLPLLNEVSISYAFDSLLTLLGVLPCGELSRGSAGGHRFTKALADIDARLSDPGLCSAMIAGLQGISRRRLDSIFAERGLSVERVIWDRRLERAASDIADPSKCARRLLEIAISWGFASEAHFSRRFRARFGMPPREFRRASERTVTTASKGR